MPTSPVRWAQAGRETLAALGVDAPAVASPSTIPCPATGVRLSITGVDAGLATCPSCEVRTESATFVAVLEDLRLLFACPACQQVTWLSGA